MTFQELLVATGFVCSCHPFTDVTTCISDFCFMTKDNGYRTENVKLLMVLMTMLLMLVQGPHTLHIATPCLPLPAMTRGTLAHSWALPSLPFTSQSFSPQHMRVRVPLSSAPPAWLGSALLGLSMWIFPEAEPAIRTCREGSEGRRRRKSITEGPHDFEQCSVIPPGPFRKPEDSPEERTLLSVSVPRH